MRAERIAKLKEWEQQKPDDAFLKFALAQEYVGDENDEAALSYLLTLLQRHSNYLPTYYQLGKLYERIGKPSDALQVYESGIELAIEQKDIKTRNELEEAIELLNE